MELIDFSVTVMVGKTECFSFSELTEISVQNIHLPLPKKKASGLRNRWAVLSMFRFGPLRSWLLISGSGVRLSAAQQTYSMAGLRHAGANGFTDFAPTLTGLSLRVLIEK